MSNITTETTIKELIELGLMKASQVETYNKRLSRKASKAADSELQTRANQAVACYIGANYKVNQKIRLTGLYQNFLEFYDFDKVAAHRAVSKSLAALVEQGVLVNNRATINNNCHMRHWIPEVTEPAVESADEAPDSDE